ncbi:MAG: ABC transporter permease [Sphingomonadales bacterium]
MRFLALTVIKEIKRRFNDPLGLIMWLMIPLILGGMLTSVLGGASGPTPKAVLLLTDLDDTFISQAIPQALGGGQLADMIEIQEVTREVGNTRINDNDGSAHLVIPEGFSEAYLNKAPIALELTTNPAQRISPKLIREVMASLLDLGHYIQLVLGDEIKLIVDGDAAADLSITDVAALISGKMEKLGPYAFPPVIEVVDETPVPEGRSLSMTLLMFPGVLVMAVVFAGQGISGIYWQDREKGILQRWRAGPNGMWVYWTGLFIASMFILGLVTFPILAGGFYLIDIPFTKLVPSLLWIMLTGPLLFGTLVLVQVMAPSRRAGGVISTLLVFPLLMAGGSFFPKETLPDVIRAVSDYTPNGQILEPLKQYFLGTYGSSGLFSTLVPLMAVTIALIAVASVIADRKELR